MLPWSHAAFGYLLYRLHTARYGSRPTGPAVLAVIFGTQFPDLVDKPLAWSLGILPSGRSLGHSVFTLLVLCGGLYLLARSIERRRTIGAFAVGYASHLVGDMLYPLARGNVAEAGYLFWPITSAPVHDHGMTIVGVFTTLRPSPTVIFGLALSLVAFLLWASDGLPGLREWRRSESADRTADRESDL
jgi:hypothetical protein